MSPKQLLKEFLRAGRLRRTWHRARFRWSAPVLDQDCILDALRKLSPTGPRVLLVHSSLSACGRIRGGTLAVIQALRGWNPQATVAMPTHTYCYPSPEGVCRVFESDETPSRVGAITEEFRKQPGVARSVHPTHSVACEGPAAEALVAGHEYCDTPCGRGTPYERLIERDVAVLMFGVTMDSYTFFHTAEDAARVPYLYEPQAVKLKLRGRDGQVHEMSMRRQDMTIARDFKKKDGWLEERGLLCRLALGCGELLLLQHSQQVHEAVLEQLRRDPWFLVATHPV